MLGLIHERTGHLNKRTIIECVKSKLVRGLQIEEKHIRKYKKEDKHVCDVCARAKLTRMSFNKIHKIRGKELGDYISVDLGVFVNCRSEASRCKNQALSCRRRRGANKQTSFERAQKRGFEIHLESGGYTGVKRDIREKVSNTWRKMSEYAVKIGTTSRFLVGCV